MTTPTFFKMTRLILKVSWSKERGCGSGTRTGMMAHCKSGVSRQCSEWVEDNLCHGAWGWGATLQAFRFLGHRIPVYFASVLFSPHDKPVKSMLSYPSYR